MNKLIQKIGKTHARIFGYVSKNFWLCIKKGQNL